MFLEGSDIMFLEESNIMFLEESNTVFLNWSNIIIFGRWGMGHYRHLPLWMSMFILVFPLYRLHERESGELLFAVYGTRRGNF